MATVFDHEIKSLFSCEDLKDIFKKTEVEFEQEGEVVTQLTTQVVFYSEIKPMSIYSLIPNKFKLSSNGKVASFNSEGQPDFLCYSYVEVEFPDQILKDEYMSEYRIAWCNYPVYSVMRHGEIRTDEDEVITEIDFHGLTNYESWFSNEGTRKLDRENMGIDKDLIKWNNVLPARLKYADTNYFYSKTPNSAFPLYLINSKSSITHTFNFQTKISKLLRVQKLEDGEWNYQNVTESLLKEIITKYKSDINTPSLWGMFSKIENWETDWYKNCMVLEKNNKSYHDIYIENMKKCNDPSNELLTEANAKKGLILSEGNLCKAVFFKAINVENKKYNIRGDYTSDINHELCPIDSVSLIYNSKVYKFKNLPAESFCGPLTSRHFKSSPKSSKLGFCAFPFCYRTYGRVIEAGINLENLHPSLKFKMKQQNKKNKYKIIVHCLLIQKIRIIDGNIKLIF